MGVKEKRRKLGMAVLLLEAEAGEVNLGYMALAYNPSIWVKEAEESGKKGRTRLNLDDQLKLDLERKD